MRDLVASGSAPKSLGERERDGRQGALLQPLFSAANFRDSVMESPAYGTDLLNCK
jgi:hypothetical protein